ncbi:MAG: hypothetical protein AAFO94_14730, partial [Bacteroidota bacterium]
DPNQFSRLRRKYEETASDFIKAGDYEKAAFIYMKLLKDYRRAAATMEQGKHYAEAAAIYLKFLKEKNKAAHCYEMANMTTQALELYVELNHFEKAGDLYRQLGEEDEALRYYKKRASQLEQANSYLQMSTLIDQKIMDRKWARDTLLIGWHKKAAAVNCANEYFRLLPETADPAYELRDFYEQRVDLHNGAQFIEVLRHQRTARPMLQDLTRQFAYELVAKLSPAKPEIVSKLLHFVKDPALSGDLMNFKRR